MIKFSDVIVEKAVQVAPVEKKTEDKVNIIVFSDRHPSRKNGYYPTVSRIVEEAKARKVNCKVYFISEINLILKDKALIIQNLKKDDKQDVFINRENTVAIIRGSLGNTLKGLSLISTLENYGVFVINSRRAFEICKNKFTTTSILSANNILCPRSVLLDSIADLDYALELVGNKFPVVLKTLEGAEGIGISILDSYASLKSTLQTMWKLTSQEFLLQEFLELDGDIRIIVLNGKVVGAMKRKKIKGDFRSNRALGAEIMNYKISKEQEDIALKSTELVNAYYSGVDLAVNRKDKKSYVIEINTSPGSTGFEEATGINVIGKLIDEIINKDNWKVSFTEAGYIETIKIKDMGSFTAKLDTGDGITSSLHCDSFEIKDNVVDFKIGKKSYSKPLNKKVRVIKHNKQFSETRPVILLDIEMNGKEYKDIPFGLTTRIGTLVDLEPVLLSRYVINKAHLLVNANKTFMLLKEDFVSL